MPAKRADFLLRNGWTPVDDRVIANNIPIVMWEDPLTTPTPGGGTRHKVMWPHEAEFVADMRLAIVRSVMEE